MNSVCYSSGVSLRKMGAMKPSESVLSMSFVVPLGDEAKELILTFIQNFLMC